jgi:hypothetical protein
MDHIDPRVVTTDLVTRLNGEEDYYQEKVRLYFRSFESLDEILSEYSMNYIRDLQTDLQLVEVKSLLVKDPDNFNKVSTSDKK